MRPRGYTHADGSRTLQVGSQAWRFVASWEHDWRESGAALLRLGGRPIIWLPWWAGVVVVALAWPVADREAAR